MPTIATPGPAWENVLSVRVNLRITSGEENNLAEQPVTLNYAGTTFTAPTGDLRLHQVFTTTISIRNRLL
jgi:type IV pilus assembly protein PilW